MTLFKIKIHLSAKFSDDLFLVVNPFRKFCPINHKFFSFFAYYPFYTLKQNKRSRDMLNDGWPTSK